MAAKQTFKSEAQEQHFNEFWSCYWRKVGKADAEKAYVKLKPTPKIHRAIMEALILQAPEMLSRSMENRPHAATWLNGRRWNDEVIVKPDVRTHGGESIFNKAILADEAYLLKKALDHPDTTEEERQTCMQWLGENA